MAKRGRPATGETPVRSVRMGKVWEEAREVAAERGENLHVVLERYLQRYVAAHREKSD